MGLWDKVLRGLGLKSSDGNHQKYKKDKTRKEDGSGLDKEETDLAIPLSRSEQDQIAQQDTERQRETESKYESGDDARRTNVKMEERNKRDKAQEEEDEPIIQKSLDAKESSPHLTVEDEKFHSKPQLEEDESKCAGCNSKIEHGGFLSRLEAVWHPECFKCHSCKIPITDDEFSKSKRRLYHKFCYKKRHHPMCIVCKDFLPTNANGRPEFMKHPFWPEMYCPKHEAVGTSKCCSCERLEPKEMKYLILDDGRKLCSECLDSAILDTHQCHGLYDDIKIFFEGLHMKVGQEFPVLLVEKNALNNAVDEEKNEHHHVAETRGVCLSKEQTVIAISLSKKPENGAGNRLTGMLKEPCRLIRRCEVTAILIINGLPRLLTGLILAHEMMHAWLRLNGYRNLEPQVEEGICQVLSHLWLESQSYSGGDTAPSSSSSSASSSPSAAATSKNGEHPNFEKKLCELFKNQIVSDSSPLYGDGFRKADEAVTTYGLERTLSHIKITGGFP